MSSAIPKHRALHNLSNVDLALRNKKVITTPTRPPAQSRVTKAKDAPIAVLFNIAPIEAPVATTTATTKPTAVVPITITDDLPEVTLPKSSRTRRVYDRDYLLQFKYKFTDFPANTPTPQQLVQQYNKDFEAKERQAALLEVASPKEKGPVPVVSTVPPPVLPAPAVASFLPPQTTGAAPSASPSSAPAKVVREKKVGEPLKFKIPTSTSTSRLAMFSSKAPATAAAQLPTPAPNTKENTPRPQKSKSAGSASVKKPKLSALPAVATAPPATTPAAPAVVTAPKPAAAPVPASAPAAVEITSAEQSADALAELAKKMKAVLREEDPRRLSQRQKQIEYGKNTTGYSAYVAAVPRTKRSREDPKTPNKHQICSKRSWDGQIRKWRRSLHFYDPNASKEDLDLDADVEMGDEGAEVSAV